MPCQSVTVAGVTVSQVDIIANTATKYLTVTWVQNIAGQVKLVLNGQTFTKNGVAGNNMDSYTYSVDGTYTVCIDPV